MSSSGEDDNLGFLQLPRATGSAMAGCWIIETKAEPLAEPQSGALCHEYFGENVVGATVSLP